jgi:hypothetical protein
MFSRALPMVAPEARCSRSGAVSSMAAKANTLSTVLPERTAPSATLNVLFRQRRM